MRARERDGSLPGRELGSLVLLVLGTEGGDNMNHERGAAISAERVCRGSSMLHQHHTSHSTYRMNIKVGAVGKGLSDLLEALQ
jgi:hypothetical protein